MADRILFDPETHTICDDGTVIDDQGEIVGRVEQVGPAEAIFITDHQAGFSITCRADAERHLASRQDEELALAQIEARRQAMKLNLDRQARRHQARLDFYTKHRDPLLAEWAKTQLVGKSRTLALDHGVISFRKSEGSVRITNQARAVEYVARYDPSLIDTKTVQTVGAEAIRRAMAIQEETEGTPRDVRDFAQVTGPGDVAKLTTGIGKEVRS